MKLFFVRPILSFSEPDTVAYFEKEFKLKAGPKSEVPDQIPIILQKAWNRKEIAIYLVQEDELFKLKKIDKEYKYSHDYYIYTWERLKQWS